MAKIIHSNEEFLRHIPNNIQIGKGEIPLFDKVSPFLDLAEDWVRNTFTSDSTFTTICGYTESNPTRWHTARLVVTDAMRRALPSLDIVLTPNGFAVVNTNNLAPASKPRVDRLVGSMLTHRDDCISALLPELVGASKWLSSKQAEFFGSTLFPTLDIVDDIGGSKDSPKWEKYLELHPQLLDLEASLAEEWFSPELMTELRYENLRGTLSTERSAVVRQIKAQIVAVLRGGCLNTRRLADVVNFIRQREDIFEAWHSSDVAELFRPPVFRNRKNSAGYFF